MISGQPGIVHSLRQRHSRAQVRGDSALAFLHGGCHTEDLSCTSPRHKGHPGGVGDDHVARVPR